MEIILKSFDVKNSVYYHNKITNYENGKNS